ncbi:hypothetical protein [Kitasatospora camelliae]|uniref:Uncharacterized protein n=1 Tax=Kitasatospora camelliae TaxID=3156397 RepID=A0AAU8JV48_9ACTN
MTPDQVSQPYRTTVTTPRSHDDVVALADELLAAWLKQEGHEEPPAPGEDPPPERLRLGPRVLLDRDEGPLRAPAGPPRPAGAPAPGRYTRRRLRTPAPHGTHQLTLTVVTGTATAPGGTEPGGTASGRTEAGPTELRVEAEHLAAAPGRSTGRVPVPDLVRSLLPLLDAADGPVPVPARPQVVTPAGVDALIDQLCDPERRLPVVVASVPSAQPLDSWIAATVEPLYRQLPGLAALYVLDHAALPLFNMALEFHKVYGGAVRTYLAEVDPASRRDNARHPVLPRSRIDEDVRRAAALLAREPRRIAADLPLPELLAAVPVLQLPPEAKLAPRRRPLPADPGGEGTGSGETRHATDPCAAERTVARPVSAQIGRPRRAAEERDCGAAGRPAGRSDTTGLTGPDDLAGIADLAEHQARVDELQRVRHSLLRARRREARMLAESDEQLAALRHVGAQVRVLTGRLRSAARPAGVDLRELAAAVRAEEAEEWAPNSFGELVGRFDEFPLLQFTGDEKETLALDGQSDGAGWARLTWDGLTALQEYAGAAVRGQAGGDFKQWCERTPAGCHRFPPRKAVRGESRAVSSHAKWKRQRMLPVPACVAPSRRAFMGAHLRIGGGGTAPRVHYLDDCSGSGRIYVGYIGLHLTNTRTN